MCNVRYRNIGCYNDFHMRQRPLPDRLSPKESECLKLRDLKVILNNETLMKAWNDNMYEFVCRCAEAAKKEKYNFFGVQNCGECWAAKGEFLVNVNGLSDQCLTYDAEDCALNSKVCVGEKYTIYAYSVVASRFGK
ncbi:uncharacterized protein LOC110059325 [Orbicella faveolata]|uniref:uncharacterized protein LOC110059325 n=1 Tax=Orbicella faveolata TaxID=48498 RepID=UPI0009E3FF7C|nr:uncharacterized protein LOC110059325 [Orbicella faveolata]